MTRRLSFGLLLLLAIAWVPASAALRAWVDNPTVAPGETVQLTLAHDGQTGTRPDLTPLKKDFDIVGSSTSTNLQIINGRASSTTQLELSLAPKHNGQLTIPSVTWDSDRSPALTLNVTANAGSNNSSANPNASGSRSRVFMETEEDPKTPYVQAAVHVTVRVYAGVPLSHGDLEFADTDAAIVRQVGTDNISNVERNGQPYQVITRHYLLFPQRSGRLSLDGPTLTGEIPDRSRAGAASDPFSGLFGNSPFSGMLGARKPIRLHAEPIVLDVQPRPASAGTTWLPARNVTLEAHWNPSLQTHVGDPVTLDMKLQAQGLTAAQLPDLSSLLHLPDQLKAYPDQPKLKDDPQGEDLVGTREQSIALIADEPGQFAIPELRLSWWDTQANQTREVTVPAQTLTVQPAPGAPTPSSTPAPSPQYAPAGAANSRAPAAAPAHRASPGAAQESARWKWISLVLGLLWLGTVVAWLITRGRGGPNRSAPTGAGNEASAGMRARPLRAAFLTACRNNDAPEARRNLLLWANATGSGAPIRGLNALSKGIENPEIVRELQALDRACYAGDSWNGAQLANLLSELPMSAGESPGRRSRELAPLYR